MPTLYIIFNDMSSLSRFFSKSRFKLFFISIHSLYVGIFYPSGEPISLHLLRCGPIAVVDHSFMGHASHLQQPRPVNNPGELIFMSGTTAISDLYRKTILFLSSFWLKYEEQCGINKKNENTCPVEPTHYSFNSIVVNHSRNYY